MNERFKLSLEPHSALSLGVGFVHIESHATCNDALSENQLAAGLETQKLGCTMSLHTVATGAIDICRKQKGSTCICSFCLRLHVIIKLFVHALSPVFRTDIHGLDPPHIGAPPVKCNLCQTIRPLLHQDIPHTDFLLILTNRSTRR